MSVPSPGHPQPNFRRSAASVAIVFVTTFLGFLFSGALRGPLRIDEAHKVADTYFFRLVLERDFSNPEWFRHIVDRTNPALPKLLFGFSVWISGNELPDTVQVRVEEPRGYLGQQFAPGAAARLRGALLASRAACLVATALTAALVFVTATELGGALAGALAALLYATQFLTQTFAATAVYDPLLTLFTTATLLPLTRIARRRRVGAPAFLALTLLCAAAYQTRITGLIAAAAVGLALAVLAARQRASRLLLFSAALVASTLVVGTALNPYYWATPRPTATNAAYSAPSALPLRIVRRYELQFRDYGALFARDRQMQHSLGGLEKLSFASQTLFADWAGLFLGVGAVLAAARLALTRRLSDDARVATLVWGIVVVGGLMLWLPFGWPRYLLPLIPPLSIAAALGWRSTLARAIDGARSRSRLKSA